MSERSNHRGSEDPNIEPATRALEAGFDSSLDPRTREVTWIAFKAAGARVGVVTSPAHLAEVLRGFADLLEKTHDPGRTAVLTRLSTAKDDAERTSLELALAVGVLGPKGETREEAEQCAAVVTAALGRFPSPFALERSDPRRLLEIPRRVATIKQRWVDVTDDTESARAPSRFDRQLESWLDVAELMLSRPEPTIFQSTFLATTLAGEEALWLEQESIRATEIRERALERGNHVVARRADRIDATLIDFSESLAGLVWVAEVIVASDAPLPRSFVRALASAISNEVDVIHAQQAAPVVAGRARLVGGHLIDYPVRRNGGLGLPEPALRKREMTDLVSLTEAALACRWPVSIADQPIPTIPIRAGRDLPAPAGLPAVGLALGRDCAGRTVFLGPQGLTSHALLVGGTNCGKSTEILAVADHYLAQGAPFVAIDPHGDLARALRFHANEAGREVALLSGNEAAGIRLDLLGGVSLGRRERRQMNSALARIVDALTSHFPKDWVGPRFRQLAMAALEVAVAASDRYTIGLEDVARMLIDKQFLQWILSETDVPHAEAVLSQHLRDNDNAGVGLWAASKFDDIAQSPGANRIFAPFLEGVSVAQVLAARLPLIVDLGGLPRLTSALIGQVVLATTVDYALSRDATDREPFPVFVDEAQRFPAVNLTDALAEGRKFGLRLVLATQDLGRLDYDLRDALIANTGTKVIFRCSTHDANVVSPLIGVPAADLCGLPNFEAFAQLTGHAPFSIKIDPPRPVGDLPEYSRPRCLCDGAVENGKGAAGVMTDQPQTAEPDLSGFVRQRSLARPRQLSLDVTSDDA